MPKVYPFAARQQQSAQAKAANQAYFMAAQQARKETRPLAPQGSLWSRLNAYALAGLALLMTPMILLGLWMFAHGN
jgi:hypothetical protein